MTESVNVPANPRTDPESFLDELVAQHHVIDDVVEVRTRLVIVNPATVDKLQLLVFDQFLYYFLSGTALSLPPFLQVPRSGLSELTILVLCKLLNHAIQCEFDACQLLILIRSSIIFVHGLVPTHVVVRVRDKMDNQLLCLVLSLSWWFHNLLLPSFGLHLQLIHLLLHSLLILI